MSFRRGIARLAEALLLPINPAVAVLLGVYTCLWGIWVANPFWEVFIEEEVYRELSQVAFILPAEVFWGGIAIFCGAVIIYGAVRRSYKSLVTGASVAGWHWFMISIFYFLGDPTATGGLTALMLSVYGAFLWLNVRINFKENKDIDDVLR